jgi:hypothetical protein
MRWSLRQREEGDDREDDKQNDRNEPGHSARLTNARSCLGAPIGWTEPPGSDSQDSEDGGEHPDAGPISDKEVGSQGCRVVEGCAGICPLLDHWEARDKQGYRNAELARSQDVEKVLRISEMRQVHANVLDA